MAKEDFLRQVEIAKQQFLGERHQEELQTRQKQLSAEAVKREKEAQKQRLEAQRIEDTKKNFAGTNIIETLEYIQKNNILVYEKLYKNVSVRDRDFLGFIFGITHPEKILDTNIPLEINYNINSVSAAFDYTGSGIRYEDDPSEMRCISIEKNDSQIQLKYSDEYQHKNDFSVASENPNDIIVGIARVVALQQVK